MYCTYITFYRGNKLPPFYIGSSSKKRLLEDNYHGSVSSERYKAIWISELESFPEKFVTKILTEHSSRQEAYIKEEYFQRAFSVHKNPMFINRSIANIEFTHDTLSETHKMNISKAKSGIPNHKSRGVKKTAESIAKRIQTREKNGNHLHTEEFKKKHSKRMSGSGNPRYGLTLTDEFKQRLSKAHDPEDHRQKTLKAIAEGRHNSQMMETCIHCGKTANMPNIKRWHNDRCRLKESVLLLV